MRQVDSVLWIAADPDPTFRFVSDPKFFEFYLQQCQCGQFIEIFWKNSKKCS
jgi:hypothetical protein